jgi:ABC-type glycerol-3-phosphate transport system substrate-binding protein
MRWIQILFLGIFSCIILTGCLDSDKLTNVGDEGETIHVLGVVGVHEAIVESLEKKLAASHIKVDKNFYYWGTFLAKARLSIMNDTREYDVIMGPCSQFSSIINYNKAVSLEDVAERVRLTPDDLYPSIRKNAIFKNNFFCLPYMADSLIYIYRADLFHRAGIKPPHTILEMLAIGKKFTSGNNYGLAFPAGPGEAATPVWNYFLWSYGGDYFDNNWTPLINSSHALIATRIYNQILQECAPPAVATWQTEEAINFFTAGHLASMILWSSSSTILNDKNRNKFAENIDYASLPVSDTGVSIPSTETWGVIVPRSSKHIISAKKFCELLMSRSSLEKIAQSGMVPTPLPVINQLYNSNSSNRAFIVATHSLTTAKESPNIPEAAQFIPVIGSALNDILMGANLDDTLDSANQQIEGIMQLSGRIKKRK